MMGYGKYRSPHELIEELITTGKTKMPCNKARTKYWSLRLLEESDPGKGIIAEVEMGANKHHAPSVWCLRNPPGIWLYIPQPQDAAAFNSAGFTTHMGSPGQYFHAVCAVFTCHVEVREDEVLIFFIQGNYKSETGVVRKMATKYNGGQIRLVRAAMRMAKELGKPIRLAHNASLRLKHVFCEASSLEGMNITTTEGGLFPDQPPRTHLVAELPLTP